MKKRLLIKIFIFMIFGFIGLPKVFASSVSIKASSSTITRGNTVTITTTISAGSGIYTIEGSMSCKGAGVNGGINLAYEDMNTSVKSKSFTHTIKPTSSGTVTCTTSNVKLRELAKESNYQLSNATITIKVNDPVVIPPKEYSSDNTLSSLSVEGYSISPKFNKNTTDYTLEVDESVEKIKVNAKVNDSKAKVSGIGEKSITPGENLIKVTVTAENGNDKVYKIVVTSVDQNPINVKIDDKKYTIVKKNNDAIDKLQYYEESTIKIDDQDVVSYKNEKSGITLVILKDSKGIVQYYVYDESNGTYQLYEEYKIGNISLNILSMESDILPDGYKKYSLKLGEEKLDGYKLKKDSKFYLIYAMNVENGKKSLYVYDEEEGTIQRYDEEIAKYFGTAINDAVDSYRNYFYIALSALGAVTIVLIVVLFTKNKEKIRKNKLKI